jgi:hypothetical protein
MKKIATNAKQYRPHIRWILKKLGLKNYNVIVAFLTVKMAKKFDVIPKEARKWTACFSPPSVIWVNPTVIKKGELWLMHILSHELRHYYQSKTKKFPMVDSILKPDHRKMSKKDKQKYLNDPREKDAIKFQLWLADVYEKEINSGKLKL